MFSNLISKGAEVITNSARVITSNTTSPTLNNNANQMTKQILNKLEIALSKELGQNIEGSLQAITNDLLKQQQLEKTLIQTKQRYHHLVAQSQLQNENMKIMIQNIIEFMKNLSNSLQNQDMLTPLKDLQSAFYACNVSKVQKQLKYFWKLYEAALDDYLKIHINSKSDQCKDEVNLFKGLNKNLQVELFRSRNNCTDLQKRVSQLHCKNQQMSQKLSILEKLGTQNIILASSKQKQKAQQRENELLERIKSLEREKSKLEKINRENENEVLKVNSAIQVVKNSQDAIIQEMKREIAKKEITYQSSISKMCTEKVNLQEKIRDLNSQISILREQVSQLKQKQVNSPKKQQKNPQIKQLTQRIKTLQQQNQEIKKAQSTMVSKEMMKMLFLGFEDQSKQWTVRRDIKNQIYLLLDIKAKKQVKSENKSQQKKWFGIF